MDETEARRILGKAIDPDNSISDGSNYMYWPNVRDGNDAIVIDGDFTEDEIEAIAWWMKNKKVKVINE